MEDENKVTIAAGISLIATSYVFKVLNETDLY